MATELTTGRGHIHGREGALVNDIMIAASDTDESIREKLDAAGSSFGEVRAVLTEKVRIAAASSSDYVKDHPLKVLGLPCC